MPVMDHYIYADNAATTRMSPAAIAAMTNALEENYGNPSSLHTPGQNAAMKLQEARNTIAGCIGALPGEIYFTSGGSESDNQAIVSAALLGAAKGKKHLISSKIEHHAVLATLKKLEKQGFELTLLDVDEKGFVSIEQLKETIRTDTALVSIMYANNEIGTIEPIGEIAKICKEKNVLFHTDAVQAAGHLPISVKETSVDFLSLSAHKFHGPKGVGALYVKKGLQPLSLIEGGAQERGKRAGTENVPGIVSMAAALKEACANMEKNAAYVSELRNRLIEGALTIEGVRLNGDEVCRLPGNVSLCLDGVDAEPLLLNLDMSRIAASSGSACSAGSLEPSHVLLSIGLSEQLARSGLRLSLDYENTKEEVDYIIENLKKITADLRQWSGR